jgi:hypothetical protein
MLLGLIEWAARSQLAAPVPIGLLASSVTATHEVRPVFSASRSMASQRLVFQFGRRSMWRRDVSSDLCWVFRILFSLG